MRALCALAAGGVLAFLLACGSSTNDSNGAEPGGAAPDGGSGGPNLGGDASHDAGAGPDGALPDDGTCGVGATLLVGDAGDVADLVVDERYVWFTRVGGVYRVPIAGGAPVRAAEGINGNPSRIVADATHVYWPDGANRIRRVAKSGGDAEDVVAAPLTQDPMTEELVHGLALLNGTLVYGGELFNANTPFVRQVAITPGSTPTTLYDGTAPLGNGTCSPRAVSDVAIHDTDAFFVYSCGTIGKVPLGGGAPTSFADVTNPERIVADDDGVFFSAAYEMGVAKPTGAVTTLGPIAFGSALVRDGATLYVLASDGLVKVPVAGGAVVRISDLKSNRALAVDANHVFWTVADFAHGINGICRRAK